MKLTNLDGSTRKTKYDWHLVDWEQPTSLIADQLGITDKQVSFARRNYAPDTVGKIHAATAKAEDLWSSVDWSKNDRSIALENGHHRGSLAKARQKYAPEDYRNIGQRASDTEAAATEFWSKVDWGKRNYVIARETGKAPSTVGNARKKHTTILPEGALSKVDWSKVDWSKRNCVIVRETGMAACTVSQARKKHAGL